MLKPAVFYSIINLEEVDACNDGKKYQNLIQNFKANVLEKGIQEIKLEISLASASLEENINLFKILLNNPHYTQLNFASLYNAATYEQLNLLIKTLLDDENAEIGVRHIKAYTPLTTNYIKKLLSSRLPESYNWANTLEIIPAIFNKKDLLNLKSLIGRLNNTSSSNENINNINSIKIFPCLVSNTKELIDSLKNPIKELQGLPLSYNDNEGLEVNDSQDLENLIELASSLKSATNISDNQRQPIPEIQIKNSYYPNRLTEISEMILSIWDINPEIHIICAGFNGASLEEIGSFYDKLIKTLSESGLHNISKQKQFIENKKLISKHELTDKISIATRNNNFNEIQEFFKYSSI
ncbi:MAG: hypothetical protein VKK32_05630 [Candidatus Melainabacteria bacterium]|nr:hypothetical protein [Candidatus Melainabacteria bacterium]